MGLHKQYDIRAFKIDFVQINDKQTEINFRKLLDTIFKRTNFKVAFNLDATASRSGRIVHLQPMSWVRDWPVMGEDLDGNGIDEPVLQYKKPVEGKQYPIQTLEESDDFDDGKYCIQW